MAPVSAGTRLGDGDRYVVERELARGGMGAVYVASDRKFPGVKIALKVAHALDPTMGDDLRQRFRREAQVGNLLGRAEGFVRAFDWGETPSGALYLAMDLVDGAKPLDLKTGTLEERLARFVEAARLVAAAHERGVIHRDLKPANYLVGADGKISLTDFGLAKVLDRTKAPEEPLASGLTRTGSAAGTPPFMPPEQFEDLSQVDERADVYALGVMLFMALTEGKPPYTGNTTTIIHQQQSVLEGARPVPSPRALAPATSPALEAICLKATALRREERLASARELVERVKAAMPSRPLSSSYGNTVGLAAPAPASVISSAPPTPRVSLPAPRAATPVPVARPVPVPVKTVAQPPPQARSTGCRTALIVAGCLGLTFCGGTGALFTLGLLGSAANNSNNNNSNNNNSNNNNTASPVMINVSTNFDSLGITLVSIDGTSMYDARFGPGSPLQTPCTGIRIYPGRHRFVFRNTLNEVEEHELIVSAAQTNYFVQLGGK